MNCGCRQNNGNGGQGLAATYESRSFTLAAGTSAFIDVNVRLVAVLSLAGADDFLIRLNDGQLGLAFASWQFRALDADGVRKVELTNPNDGSIDITLALARSGEMIDGRFSLPGQLSVTEQHAELDSTADVTIGDGATGQVLAANATRVEAMIQNLDDALSVRIGDSNVAAARGLRLAPGDVLTLTTSAAIHAHNPNGEDVDLAVLELSA